MLTTMIPMNTNTEEDNETKDGVEAEEGGVITGRIPGAFVGASTSTGADASPNRRLSNFATLASPISFEAAQ